MNRLLSKEEAAKYVGLSATTYETHVNNGVFPAAIRLGRRLLWDKKALDIKLDELSGITVKSDHENPWKDAM